MVLDTAEVDGVGFESGNTCDAAIKLDADYKTVFEFPPRKDGSKKKRSK